MSLRRNRGEKMVEIEKKKPQRHCCACKKVRKIVNVGGPPLCETCYPLACNWSKAVEQHKKFEMSIAGITAELVDTGSTDDMSYFLEEIAKYHAEAKMKLKQADICLINVCTMLRNEKSHKRRGKQMTIAEVVSKEQTTLPEKKSSPVIQTEVKAKKEKDDWEPIKRKGK